MEPCAVAGRELLDGSGGCWMRRELDLAGILALAVEEEPKSRSNDVTENTVEEDWIDMVLWRCFSARSSSIFASSLATSAGDMIC